MYLYGKGVEKVCTFSLFFFFSQTKANLFLCGMLGTPLNSENYQVYNLHWRQEKKKIPKKWINTKMEQDRTIIMCLVKKILLIEDKMVNCVRIKYFSPDCYCVFYRTMRKLSNTSLWQLNKAGWMVNYSWALCTLVSVLHPIYDTIINIYNVLQWWVILLNGL